MSEHTPPIPIATLHFTNEKTGDFVKDAHVIWPKEEYSFGRKEVRQLVNDHDPTISAHHLAIRCVQFDENTARWHVSPMIYAQDHSLNGTILRRQYQEDNGKYVQYEGRLTEATGPVLLENGDKLYFSESTFMELEETNSEQNDSSMNHVMICETQRFMKSFNVAPRLIGAGGQGKIFIALDEETTQQVACKVVALRGVELAHHRIGLDASSPSPVIGSESLPDTIHRLEVEYDILKDLDHPNIINIKKVFIATHHIYIIQELMAGGDLFSYIDQKGGRLEEAQSAAITRQVLKGLDYMHERGIVHRDIKPDNILMTSWQDSARVVLTDFGLSKKISRSGNVSSKIGQPYRMFSACGTTGFVAPEVHSRNPTIPEDQGYSVAIDLWSVGIVTSLMLTGNLAIDDRESQIQPSYNLTLIDRGEQGWDTVSRRAKDFVKSLLVLVEKKRLTAKQALQHNWFTNRTCASFFDAVYARSIRDWKPRNKSNRDIVVHIDTSDITAPSPIVTQIVRCSTPPASLYRSEYFHSTVLSSLRDGLLEIPETTPPQPGIQQLSQALPWSSPILGAKQTFPLRDHTNASDVNHNLPDEHINPNAPPAPNENDGDLDSLKPSSEFTWPSPVHKAIRRVLPHHTFQGRGEIQPSVELPMFSPPRRNVRVNGH